MEQQRHPHPTCYAPRGTNGGVIFLQVAGAASFIDGEILNPEVGLGLDPFQPQYPAIDYRGSADASSCSFTPPLEGARWTRGRPTYPRFGGSDSVQREGGSG